MFLHTIAHFVKRIFEVAVIASLFCCICLKNLFHLKSKDSLKFGGFAPTTRSMLLAALVNLIY